MLLSVKEVIFGDLVEWPKKKKKDVYICLKVWVGFNASFKREDSLIFLMQMNVQHLDVLFFFLSGTVKLLPFYSSLGAFCFSLWYKRTLNTPYLIPVDPSHTVPSRYSLPTLPNQSTTTVFTQMQMPFFVFAHFFSDQPLLFVCNCRKLIIFKSRETCQEYDVWVIFYCKIIKRFFN